MKIQSEKYGDIIVIPNCPLIDSTEILEFKTEVNVAEDGTEYRNPLREQPRQSLNFNYLSLKKNMGDMFHMLYSNLRGYWGIPLLHLKQQIDNVEDDDFIRMDTSLNPDLHLGYALIKSQANDTIVELERIGRYVVIQEEIIDPETEEVIQEEIIEYQDGFRLDKEITVSNATIMPIRICMIDGSVAINSGGRWSNSQIKFVAVAEDAPEDLVIIPEQYQGKDYYSKPLLLDGDSLEMELAQHQVFVDGGVGGFVQFTNVDKPRYIKPFKSILKGKQALFDYRKFLMRRIGQYREFWLPLYEKHLNVVNQGMLSNWLDVDTQFVIEADRKHIAIKVNDVWSPYEITNKVINANITRLTVSPAINTNTSNIQSICYLGLYRLSADRIEFGFKGGGITQAVVPIEEIDS